MSTAPGHEHWADSTGAYLLGALDDAERDGFEAHMAQCPACTAEVEQLLVAVDALPMAVPQMSAPPALGDRIMATVRAEAELLNAAGASADRVAAPAERRRRSWVPAWLSSSPGLAVAACAAILAVGVAAGVGLSDDGPGTRTVIAEVEAPDAEVKLVVDEDEHSTLVASNLPAPPSGRVYQVWIKRPGSAPEATDALFTVRKDGSAAVDVPGSLEGVEAVLVTDEPPGGSDAPTGRAIIAASPA